MSDKDYKSIDELAKEALKAIKESKNRSERIHEEEIAKKEQLLKDEINNKIKQKIRLSESNEKEEPSPIDSRFNVLWENIESKNSLYEGTVDGELVFRIKRGFMLFHLHVLDSDFLNENWEKTGYTSIILDKLKEKADKILSRKDTQLDNKDNEVDESDEIDENLDQ